MTDALLLELEGVVVETEPLWRDALIETLDEHGIDVPPLAVDALRDAPVRARVEHLLRASGAAVDETTHDVIVIGATRRFGASLRLGMTLVPGARELLERARNVMRVAVVTRAGRAHAEVMLTESGLETVVEFTITAEDAPPKPAPAAYERALARLGRRRAVSRHAVLALEDGEVGARAARGAGLRCTIVAAHDRGSLACLWDELSVPHAERAG